MMSGHEVVEKIKLMTGSTEAAEYALSLIRKEVLKSKSIEEACFLLIDISRKFIELRGTSALIINTLRELLIKALESLSKGLDHLKKELSELIDSKLKYAKWATQKLGEIGARRLREREVILVHSYSYSVYKIIEEALKLGKRIEVYVTESRPGLEGLVMANALEKLGIPVTLIVDSAVRFVMPRITRVLVGAEAIAANGAVVGKVGTSVIALAAKEARVRMFVAAGTYKFSLETVFGELIPIPQAPKEYVVEDKELAGKIKTYAPLMDVTPADYIDAIITERGVIAPQAVPLILREIYGSWPPKLKDLNKLILELEEKCRRMK